MSLSGGRYYEVMDMKYAVLIQRPVPKQLMFLYNLALQNQYSPRKVFRSTLYFVTKYLVIYVRDVSNVKHKCR